MEVAIEWILAMPEDMHCTMLAGPLAALPHPSQPRGSWASMTGSGPGAGPGSGSREAGMWGGPGEASSSSMGTSPCLFHQARVQQAHGPGPGAGEGLVAMVLEPRRVPLKVRGSLGLPGSMAPKLSTLTYTPTMPSTSPKPLATLHPEPSTSPILYPLPPEFP